MSLPGWCVAGRVKTPAVLPESLVASRLHRKGGMGQMSLSVVAAFMAGGSDWDRLVDGMGGAVGVGRESGAPGGDSRPPDLTLSQIGPRVEGKSEVVVGRAVASWAGGSATWSKLKVSGRGRIGGGVRSSIHGFSAASRRKLLELCNQIDHEAIAGRSHMFVGLTMPGGAEWCSFCPRAAKKMLRAFLKRHRRTYGPLSIIWKLEPQERGAPHFHLMVLGLPADLHVVGYRTWVADNWWEVVGSGEASHRRSGTSASRMRTWNGVKWYAAKYIGKVVSPGFWKNPGRWWGVECRASLPIKLEERELERAEAVMVKRVARRWVERQPLGKRCTLVTPHGVKFRSEVDAINEAILVNAGTKVFRRRHHVRRGRGLVGITTHLPAREWKRLLDYVHDRCHLSCKPTMDYRTLEGGGRGLAG